MPICLKRGILLITALLLFPCKHQAQTVTDVDGNEYPTITIGTQVWMAENLKTTRYNDSTGIPMITDSTLWGHSTSPGYCWYSNTATYKEIFGALYNWFAVNTGKLAPAGWHVPTDEEWTTLIDFLGGSNTAGGKLKSMGTIEVGTSYWYTPNTGASNASGFSSLPGGARELDGNFNYLFSFGYFWSATESRSDYAYYRQLSYNYPDVLRSALNKPDGLSVRCVKNTEPGIDTKDPAKLLILFPNPASDHVMIGCAENQPLDCKIFNILGTLLLRREGAGNLLKIDVRTLPAGIYFVQVTGPNWQILRKLVIE